MSNIKILPEDRFSIKGLLKYTKTNNDCKEWLLGKRSGGYGSVRWDGTHFSVHRLVYNLAHPDEDITNLFIRHRCDNPSCINPEHLESGTPQDNTDDMISKERNAKGSKHGRSKLTEGQILQIRHLYSFGNITYKELGRIYNIDFSTVGKIIKKRRWSHV